MKVKLEVLLLENGSFRLSNFSLTEPNKTYLITFENGEFYAEFEENEKEPS